MEETTGRSNRLGLIILGAVAALLIIAALIYAVFFHGKIEMNPKGTVGNTAGNLNNGGLFCEYEDVVYFANPLDGNALYSMAPDESNVKKLYPMSVCNILAGGKYLYYFQTGASETSGIGSITSTHSMNRIGLKGGKSVELTRDVVTSGQLVDNYLYLLTAGKEHPIFYKIRIDKKDQVHLADYAINPACAGYGMIYYNETQDNHALYRLNTQSDTSAKIWDGKVWYPVLSGEYIYYMDVASDYRLCRYSLSSETEEILTNDRVECFNVGSGYIYYQTNDAVSPQLKCMHTDGSNVFTVADGVFTKINMTSQYVYFQQFGIDGTLFHSRLGNAGYNTFGN